MTNQERLHRTPENTFHSGGLCPPGSKTNLNQVPRGGRHENFESKLKAGPKGIDKGTGEGKRNGNIMRRKHQMEECISLGRFQLHATKMLQGAGGAHSTLLTK